MLTFTSKPSATLPEKLRFDGVELPLVVTRHQTARRITLRYDPHRRSVNLTLPRYAPLRVAAGFLREKREWLAEQVVRHPEAKPYEHGMIIPVLGEKLHLRHHNELRGGIQRVGNTLHVHAPEEFMQKRLENWLKEEVREAILAEAYACARQIGVRFNRLSVRETHSRWGSCSADKNLSFCWRLVFAPFPVLHYVVAHEVAHLRHMHHGPTFWETVEAIHPDYEDARDWLVKNAALLHRFGKDL